MRARILAIIAVFAVLSALSVWAVSSVRTPAGQLSPPLQEDCATIDWDALMEVNPDIVGWIEIEGTNVSQPIVRANADDPEFYLKHALDGSWHYAGTPYLDASCTAGLLDSQLSLVYGHHLNDGSVFSDLALYADEGFLKRHQEIAVRTPEHDVTYRVIAARKVDASAENSVVEFPSTASLREWLAGQLEIADARLAGDFATNRVLALVTCSYGTFKNERTIVYAIPISCDGETIRYPSDMNRLLGKSGA